MLRLTLRLCCLFCLLTGQAALYAQSLTFDEGCDFGTIYEKDGKTIREFTFRNDTPSDVVICEITTGCRCINGEPSFKVVKPGSTGTVRISFDPAYRSGEFSYPVILWYADRMARKTVNVKGNVVPMKHPIEEDHPYGLGEGLYTSHKVLPFGTIRCGETKRMFFRYGNGTREQMELTFVVEGCCSHAIDMERHFSLAPDERGKLYVSITMPYGYSGSHVNRIWPVVNGVRLETPIIVKMTTSR